MPTMIQELVVVVDHVLVDLVVVDVLVFLVVVFIVFDYVVFVVDLIFFFKIIII